MNDRQRAYQHGYACAKFGLYTLSDNPHNLYTYPEFLLWYSWHQGYMSFIEVELCLA